MKLITITTSIAVAITNPLYAQQDTNTNQKKEPKIITLKSGTQLTIPPNSIYYKLLNKTGKINSTKLANPTQYPITAERFSEARKKWKKQIKKSKEESQKKYDEITKTKGQTTFDIKSVKEIGPLAGRTIIKKKETYTAVPSSAIIYVPEELENIIGAKPEEIEGLTHYEVLDFINKNQTLFKTFAVTKGQIQSKQDPKTMIPALIMPQSVLDFAKLNKKILIATLDGGICGHNITIK